MDADRGLSGFKQFDPIADTETVMWLGCWQNTICGFKQFDPIADTETLHRFFVPLARLRFKQFDPIADTETRASRFERIPRHGLQTIRSDCGY